MTHDATPDHIDSSSVESTPLSLPGVDSLHDLHIWNISTRELALTVHLVVPEVEDHDQFIVRASQEPHDRFEIEHTTLRIEQGDPQFPCRLAPEEMA